MYAVARLSRTAPTRALSHVPRTALNHSRSPAYRRLQSTLRASGNIYGSPLTSSATESQLVQLPSRLSPTLLRLASAPAARVRTFASQSRGKPADEPPPTEQAQKAAEGKEESKQETSEEPQKEGSSGAKDAEGEDGGAESESQKKSEKDLPPPPPHGDKTPWQVFMETMNTEFEASKEWKESTKALASSAHEFSESESVQRARKAYETTTGVVSDTASTVIKSTAGAIGKGASWTWETPVMKGVRKGAAVTGDALEKATRPIRETEAYKNVKDVIDDGSSSRYGGWIEKEERRRRRELRDREPGAQPREVFEEDPKYVPPLPGFRPNRVASNF